MIKHRQFGFTIVELLIVIVVIGLLAALALNTVSNARTRAQNAKIASDISAINKAVSAARQVRSQTFMGVTGSSASGANCWGKATGTDLATLAASDACIVAYDNALDVISTAAGTNIRGIRDPWGRPYMIDENEGEGGGCSKDTVSVYKYPFTTGFGIYSGLSLNNVNLSGFSGC